jgi:hypothetical protein
VGKWSVTDKSLSAAQWLTLYTQAVRMLPDRAKGLKAQSPSSDSLSVKAF